MSKPQAAPDQEATVYVYLVRAGMPTLSGIATLAAIAQDRHRTSVSRRQATVRREAVEED